MHQILLVEDDENSYDMLIGRLQRRNYDMTLAQTGEKALELVGEQTFDLVLMDIRLPGFDGYETTRRIRERSANGETLPIIAITAQSMKEDRDKALAAGCDDYHAKPIHLSKLLGQMERLLEPS